MTEAEWLECTDPEKMLVYLRTHVAVSERKSRLIACGCCRRLWDRLEGEWQPGRDAIDVVERFLDGSASETKLRAAQRAYAVAHHRSNRLLGRDDRLEPIRYIFPHLSDDCPGYTGPMAMHYAAKAARDAIRKKHRGPEYPAQAALFRDILGNPFHPATADPAWLSWKDGAIPKLAASIYQERAFDRLPVLADALEKVGCMNVKILAHCRGPGPHVLGCWAVDTLLGKE